MRDVLIAGGVLMFFDEDEMKLPPELITIVEEGWQREIVFLKKDAKKVFDLLYQDGIKFDYKKRLNRINGKVVRLIGWGD